MSGQMIDLSARRKTEQPTTEENQEHAKTVEDIHTMFADQCNSTIPHGEAGVTWYTQHVGHQDALIKKAILVGTKLMVRSKVDPEQIVNPSFVVTNEGVVMSGLIPTGLCNEKGQPTAHPITYMVPPTALCEPDIEKAADLTEAHAQEIEEKVKMIRESRENTIQ